MALLNRKVTSGGVHVLFSHLQVSVRVRNVNSWLIVRISIITVWRKLRHHIL